MVAARFVVAAFALLAVSTCAQKPPPKTAGNRTNGANQQPPPPRADVKQDLADFMNTCLAGASTAAEKLACRESAKVQFANMTRGNAEMEGKKGEAFFEQFQRKAAEGKAKEKVGACLEADGQTEQQMRTCMSRARAALGSELDDFMKPGKTAQEKTRQKDAMEKDAARSIMGDLFSKCVQTFSKEVCKQRLANRKAAAGLSGEDTEGIVKRHISKMLMKPAENCTSGDMKQCREDAKREAMAGGMARHEYATMKKMGEVKAAAETWATCKEAGNDDAACGDMVKDEYVRVSGARAADFSQELEDKVKSLGRAIRNGETIRVVKYKRMLVDAFASGSDCVQTLEALFAAKVETLAKANSSNVSRSIARKCRVVDLKPDYGAKVSVDLDDADIEALAASTATNLQGQTFRRLQEAELGNLGRRLASVEEVFASQDVAECSAADAACVSGEAPTPAPTPTASSLSGASRVAAVASLSAAVLGLALL